ncbi:MAG: helix-turn-helix domain-containing protein [Chloroflexota bacterium]
MTDLSHTLEALQAARDELERRGIGDVAAVLGRAISELHSADVPSARSLVTTGEAAQLLGVRSVNTIKRWAADGILDGFRRGGRVLVTRASVERMLSDSRLSLHQRRERELDAALAPFDAGDDLPESTPSTSTWDGRRPWATDVARTS